MFNTIVMVDWSAATQPKTGRDSIWICRRGQHGESLHNPPTRHEAKALLGAIIAEGLAEDGRVLVGCDFPFGYPAGFAARLGLSGLAWRAVWDEIARLVEDGPDNANNRFAVAAALNRRVSNGSFPFWGCPVRLADPWLGPRHHRGHGEGGLAERRLIDEYMVGAQPCWKLLGAGSVGGQVLTGLPVVRALRDDPRWHEVAQIWPFETGLRSPVAARLVFAEVWPSWWDWKPSRQPDEIADRAQVRHVAGFFAARATAGELEAYFAGAPELTAAQRRLVEDEEAWTLGVIARRERRSAARLAAAQP